MYADDLLIITDNKKDMQTALDLISKYGEENFIKFNPEKTCSMVCNKNPKKSIKLSLLENSIGHLTLDNKSIQVVEFLKYLGVTISNKNSPDKQRISYKGNSLPSQR